jgi:hypothetical protein
LGLSYWECAYAYLWLLAEAEPGEGHELLLALGEFVLGIHAEDVLGDCRFVRGWESVPDQCERDCGPKLGSENLQTLSLGCVVDVDVCVDVG